MDRVVHNAEVQAQKFCVKTTSPRSHIALPLSFCPTLSIVRADNDFTRIPATWLPLTHAADCSPSLLSYRGAGSIRTDLVM